MNRPIYLDHHATTPLDPRVREELLPFLGEKLGNASSRSHLFGHEAAAAVETARSRVATLLGAQPEEIVFTSGATEANNLALQGSVRAWGDSGGHVVTTAIEHAAVLEPCRALAEEGAELTVVGVEASGLVDPSAVLAAVTDRTRLVSVMAANNEVGTVQPVAEIARACRERGVRLHCDGAQAVGRMPVDVEALGVDLLTLSAHKFHGPKGVGALWIRRGMAGPRIRPLVHGGGQERGLRPGTLDVPAIVGLGRAAEIAGSEMPAETLRLRRLRDRLEGRLAALPGTRINGARESRLAGSLSLTFEGLDTEELLLAVPGVACSTGAACSSESAAPSHVLKALGLGRREIAGTLRLCLGRFTTEEDVDEAADRLLAGAASLRGLT